MSFLKIWFYFVFWILIVTGLAGCSLFYTTEKSYVYQVKQGDTLASIAANFQIDFRHLAKYNSIGNPNQIVVGQVLEIPFATFQKLQAGNKKSSLEFSKTSLTQRRKAKPNHNLLRWPVSSTQAKLSSNYGWRWLKFHEGIDLAAPTGTPIYAAHPGKVMVSGYQIRGYGKMLIIQNNDLLTVYAHNSENRVDVGMYVSAGQHIANVGATGKATGPHLHFEVRFRNEDRKFVSVNPREYLP